ncbi:MAG: outer membrane protein assembly factor BamA [Spirochaetaceae bacterium JB067]
MFKKLLPLVMLIALFSPLFGEELAPWWEGRPIDEVIFANLENVEENDVSPITEKLVNSDYDQQKVDAVIEELMETENFISIDVFPSPVDEQKSSLILFLEVVESLPLGKITFEGNKLLPTEVLKKDLPLEIDAIFSVSQAENAVEHLKDVYRENGYDTVDIFYEWGPDSDNTSIEITFSITEYDWYINKPIKGFTYQNLKNVEQSVIEDITYEYLGKPFTQALYKELETKLNNLNKFSLFEAEAVRGGLGKTDLIIDFNFTELPVIASIEFTNNATVRDNTLLKELSIKVGDFLTLSKVKDGSAELTAAYNSRGYADAEVRSSYKIDDQTNTIVLTYNCIENRQSKVEEILFEGINQVPESTIRKVLQTKVQSLFNSGNFEEAVIEKDRQQIVMTYQQMGFIDAKVTEVRYEEVEQDNPLLKKLRVTFVVQEGDKWYLDDIYIEGNEIFTDEDFRKVISVKSGDVLDTTKVQADISNIADLYWNEGYVENSIDIKEKRDEENKTVAYTVSIVEREQATVEKVVINGLTKTKEYVLRRELSLNEGDVFSKQKYIQSAQNLYNTGLLTDVVPTITYGTEENTLVVTYTVTEGNQMNVGFGATFGGDVEGFPISGFLSWEDSNLGGTGRDLTVSTELSSTSQSVSVSFSDDWLRGKRWANALTFSFSRSTVSSAMILGDGSETTESTDNEAYPYPYESYEDWVNSGQNTPDSEYLMPYTSYKFSLGYNTGYTFMFDAGRLSVAAGPTFTLNRAYYDESLYTPYDYLIGKYNEAWQFSNRLSFAVTWDGRDLINNTTKGYLLKQNLTYAGGILGGLSNYMKSTTSASAYLKLFDIPSEDPIPVVASLNSTVSFMFDQLYYDDGAWTTGISASLYEYLYIDGMTIARGIDPQFYKEFMWDSSLELSVQIAENILWGEAFVSATGVSGSLSTVGTDPLDWYFAAGVGIKLDIPGFPLGLYLVKNALIEDGGAFEWDGGTIFADDDDDTSGLKLVLAITSTIY